MWTKKYICVSVMAESQVKSREAKVHFDEESFEGEKAKTQNNLKRNEIFDINLSVWLV